MTTWRSDEVRCMICLEVHHSMYLQMLLMEEIRRSPVAVGRLSHYLQRFNTIPGGAEFLPSKVSSSFPETFTPFTTEVCFVSLRLLANRKSPMYVFKKMAVFFWCITLVGDGWTTHLKNIRQKYDNLSPLLWGENSEKYVKPPPI